MGKPCPMPSENDSYQNIGTDIAMSIIAKYPMVGQNDIVRQIYQTIKSDRQNKIEVHEDEALYLKDMLEQLATAYEAPENKSAD